MSSWIKRVFTKDEPTADDRPADSDPPRSLLSDGILDIRPVARRPEPAPALAEADQAMPAEVDPEPGTPSSSGDGSATEMPAPAVTQDAPPQDVSPEAPALSGADGPARSAAVAALLESARAALGAQTVALFWHDPEDAQFALTAPQAEPAGAFVIDALVTDCEGVPGAGRFCATAALAGVPDDANVMLSGAALDALMYYDGSASRPGSAVAIPVPAADAPTTFLVADRPPEHAVFDADRLALLVGYARLVADLLALDAPPEWTPEDEAPHDGPPRTRREIIAEEMAAARLDGRPLALALVYRADAEEVAAEGTRAVEQGETLLRRRIERASPEGRVERFGELTYGVFMAASGEQIEGWAEELHTAPHPDGPDATTAPLLVGAVVLTDAHESPDTFRAAATRALEEAYAENAGWVIYDERQPG